MPSRILVGAPQPPAWLTRAAVAVLGAPAILLTLVAHVVSAPRPWPGRNRDGHERLRSIRARRDGRTATLRHTSAPVSSAPVPSAQPPRRREHREWLVTLTDGNEVVLRLACARDTQLLVDMHRRCSPDSLYLRYLSITYELPQALLPSLLGLRPGALALVAETSDGIVALANLFRTDNVSGETALLVEDAWQRRGVGTALAHRLIALAGDSDIRVLAAVTMHGNPGPLRVMARLGHSVEVHALDGLLELRWSLPETALPAARTASAPDSGWN